MYFLDKNEHYLRTYCIILLFKTTVPHLPGTIIVNQGEMLSRFSQGKFRAPVHRVSAKHKNDRIRLEYFIVFGLI